MSNKKFLKNLLATGAVFGVVATGAMEASAAAMRDVGAADINLNALGAFVSGTDGIFFSNPASKTVTVTAAASIVGVDTLATAVAGGKIVLRAATTIGSMSGAGGLVAVDTANHILTLGGAQYAAASAGRQPLNTYDKLGPVTMAAGGGVTANVVAAATGVTFANTFDGAGALIVNAAANGGNARGGSARFTADIGKNTAVASVVATAGNATVGGAGANNDGGAVTYDQSVRASGAITGTGGAGAAGAAGALAGGAATFTGTVESTGGKVTMTGGAGGAGGAANAGGAGGAATAAATVKGDTIDLTSGAGGTFAAAGHNGGNGGLVSIAGVVTSAKASTVISGAGGAGAAFAANAGSGGAINIAETYSTGGLLTVTSGAGGAGHNTANSTGGAGGKITFTKTVTVTTGGATITTGRGGDAGVANGNGGIGGDIEFTKGLTVLSGDINLTTGNGGTTARGGRGGNLLFSEVVTAADGDINATVGAAGGVAGGTMTFAKGAIVTGANKALRINSAGEVTINGGDLAGNLYFAAAGEANIADGFKITGTTKTNAPNTGVVTFAGATTIAAQMGEDGRVLNQVNIGDVGKTIDILADVYATKLNLAVGDATTIINVGKAGQGQKITGEFDNAVANAGVINFYGKSEITGVVGATQAFKAMNLLEGDTRFSKADGYKMDGTEVKFAADSTFTINANNPNAAGTSLGHAKFSTAKTGTGTVAFNHDIEFGEDQGTQGLKLKAFALTGDKTITVVDGKNIFADITTDKDGEGTVVFEGDATVGSVGTSTKKFKAITLDNVNAKTLTADQINGAFSFVQAAHTLTIADGGSTSGTIGATGVAGTLTFAGNGTMNSAAGVAATPLTVFSLGVDKKTVNVGADVFAVTTNQGAGTVKVTKDVTFTGNYVTVDGSTIVVDANKQVITGNLSLPGVLNINTTFDAAKGVAGGVEVGGALANLVANKSNLNVTVNGSGIPTATQKKLVFSVNGQTLDNFNAATGLKAGEEVAVLKGKANRFVVFSGKFEATGANSAANGFAFNVTGKNDATILSGIVATGKGASANASSFASTLANEFSKVNVTGSAAALYEDLGEMDTDAQRVESVNRVVSRELAGTAANATLDATNNALSARLASTGVMSMASNNAGVAAGSADSEMGAWVSGFAGRATQKARKGDAGYKANTQGGVVGFDIALNDATTVGVAAVMSQTNAKYKNAKSGDKNKATTYMFAVYGSRDFGSNWFGEASAMFGNSSVKNNAKRLTSAGYETATGKFDAMSYSMKALAGYNYKASDSFTITPMAGLAYTRINEGGYRETGTTNQNLSVSKKAVDRIEGILGARVATVTDMGGLAVTPEAHVFMNYNFKNKAPKVDARLDGLNGALPTSMAKPAALSTNVGLSLTAKSGMMEYGAGADMQFANKYSAYQGALKVRVNF
jgi:outer membrane autotransporter protein